MPEVNIGNSEISITKVGSILVALVIAIIWIYNTIIIPVGQMQLTLVQIQIGLAENKAALMAVSAKDIDQDGRLNALENSMGIVKAKLNLK